MVGAYVVVVAMAFLAASLLWDVSDLFLRWDWCPACQRRYYLRYGTLLRREAYCPTCGFRLVRHREEPRRCPNGHAVGKYQKYCHRCGARILEDV